MTIIICNIIDFRVQILASTLVIMLINGFIRFTLQVVCYGLEYKN
jgi:hypothetical protein